MAVATRQPRQQMRFGWDTEDSYLRNLDYNAQAIQYDGAYCTSRYTQSGAVTVQSCEYFEARVLPRLDHGCIITEIGCGQGEFVEKLREFGFEAHGFDPVLTRPNDYLVAEMWDPDKSPSTDLIVMRCVLPHVEEPWDFLDAIAKSKGDVMVLVEFQRLEWTLEIGVWHQFCHDHVNMFSVQDFKTRYELIDHGQFANGEWGWVLFAPQMQRSDWGYDFKMLGKLENALESRKKWLGGLSEKSKVRVIWGGAAKGTVLADAMDQVGFGAVVAVDSNPQKWGRYMEGSGVQIISPTDFIRRFNECEVLVANPNHVSEVGNFLSSTRANVCTVSSLTV